METIQAMEQTAPAEGENSAPMGQEGAAPSEGGRDSLSEEVAKKAQQLCYQAEMLQRITGEDMMARFETDTDMHEKVLRGEWDFIDAYAALGKASPLPSPVRSGGSGLPGMNVAAMSESQFRRLDEMLSQGGSVRM